MKLTPFEHQLRRNRFIRAIGHNPLAPDCLWAQPQDYDHPKESCAPCRKLRRKFHL